jgi:hypothetical protein
MMATIPHTDFLRSSIAATFSCPQILFLYQLEVAIMANKQFQLLCLENPLLDIQGQG